MNNGLAIISTYEVQMLQSERYKTVFYRAHFLKHLCANAAALFLFIFVLFTTPFNYKMDKAYKLLCMGLEPGAVGW